MVPAAWISSVPGWPMMSFSSMLESPVGLGIGPSFCEANCAMLFVLVAGLTLRCAAGVVVKNGWANRNGADFVLRELSAFAGAAFLATFLELLDFLAMEYSSQNNGWVRPRCLRWSTRRI